MNATAQQQIAALTEVMFALTSAQEALKPIVGPVEATRPFLTELHRDIGARIGGIHEEIADIIMDGR